jgi:hypothetical protein
VTRMCRPSRGVRLLIGIFEFFEQLLGPVFRAFLNVFDTCLT